MEWVEREKPSDYFLRPGTKKLGEKIKVWQVQTKQFPEIDPGLVSSRERFVDTPDAEIISGGVNGKGPTSVAIGRHGNYLLWGFYARPEHMTPSARNAFVNAVCYIDKFDGNKPGPVVSTYDPRDAVLSNVYMMRSVSDPYVDQMVKDFAEMSEKHPPPEEMLQKIGDDPHAYFRSVYADFVAQRLEKIPAEVRELCDDDTEKLIDYYEQNFEFLRKADGETYVVDPDVKALRISNRETALLEKCIGMLDEEDESETAIRLLKRYTGKDRDPGDWRRWWNKNRDKIRYEASSEVFVVSP